MCCLWFTWAPCCWFLIFNTMHWWWSVFHPWYLSKNNVIEKNCTFIFKSVWIKMNHLLLWWSQYQFYPTFSCLISSFLTDLRLARRSMEPLCLEPSRARIISSAETRTFLRAGFLNLPPRSWTFSFSSWIWNERGEGWLQDRVTDRSPTVYIQPLNLTVIRQVPLNVFVLIVI